jgi:hypothetical protein
VFLEYTTLYLADVSLVFCNITVYCNACTVVASIIHTSSLCYVIQAEVHNNGALLYQDLRHVE